MRLIRKGTLLGLILSFFMVLTANAEETTKNQEVKKEFYGEIRTTFANISNESEDGKAFFDMTSDAILGFKAEQMIGNLKSTAKLEFEIESFDNAILHPKKVYITLESDSLLGRLGRNDPSGHTVGREFLEGFEQSYEVGVSFGRGDYLEIQHKKAGLSFIVGQNGNAADINKGTPESVL
ncbi:MAG: hypothetical protein OEY59_11895, partial [Deltaproteobacteria bacterium]|nr:hypothetical protein [Deltaproteobacteria bacterium]